MFADIVQRFESPLNALYRERKAREARGQKIIDLVSGNVNRAGFIFPPKILHAALSQGARRAAIYAPIPLGQPAARQAVSAYYRSQGVAIPWQQIVMTPGSSLSYLYVFKVLANPGDEILCPTPNYALLDSIADLAGVRITSYRLREGARWTLDLDHMRSQITAKTRAIVLISPHNPTGAVATVKELKDVAAIAHEHKLPVIMDEVFSGFVFNGKRLPRPKAPLLFTLNGVSKLLALPGMKLGWIGVTGDRELTQKALHALDMVSDTFLPVNEPAQFALPVLLRGGKLFLRAYQRGVQNHMQRTISDLTRQRITFVKPEGGFYLTVRLPEGTDEDTFALNLLRKKGILVHPGYFYGLEGSHIIISFISSVPNGALRLR